jgi:lipopolysaccharide export system permease protein
MLRAERYIGTAVLSSIAMVMSVLMVLGGLFQFIGQQGDIGIGRYGVLNAFEYAAMNLPRFAVESLPVGTLIGAMLAIGALARTHEITALRAAGMNKLRLVWAALGAGMVVTALAYVTSEYLAPRLEQLADQRKALAEYDNISFAGRGGAWVRDGNTIINVQSQSASAEFADLLVFEFQSGGALRLIGRAERATADGKDAWQLHDYSESRFDTLGVTAGHSTTRLLQSAAIADFLQRAVTAPSQMALQALYRAINYRRSNELEATSYEFAFWSRIASLAALLVAVVFAVPFGFGLMRSAGSGARTTLGLVIGLLYFFLQRMVSSGAVVFNLPAVVLAWMPTIILAVIAAVLLRRAR